jgi:hypothetical protein
MPTGRCVFNFIFIDQDDDNVQIKSVVFNKEIPSKYKEILSVEDEDNLIYDNVGRVHLPTPYSGNVSIRMRATKFHSSTIATHISDLYDILSGCPKTSCMLLSDGGPDYTPASIVNILFYFRLFKELNFDILTVSTYAARYSAYNPIEHLWSPLSNLLAGEFIRYYLRLNVFYNLFIYYYIILCSGNFSKFSHLSNLH